MPWNNKNNNRKDSSCSPRLGLESLPIPNKCTKLCTPDSPKISLEEICVCNDHFCTSNTCCYDPEAVKPSQQIHTTDKNPRHEANVRESCCGPDTIVPYPMTDFNIEPCVGIFDIRPPKTRSCEARLPVTRPCCERTISEEARRPPQIDAPTCYKQTGCLEDIGKSRMRAMPIPSGKSPQKKNYIIASKTSGIKKTILKSNSSKSSGKSSRSHKSSESSNKSYKKKKFKKGVCKCNKSGFILNPFRKKGKCECRIKNECSKTSSKSNASTRSSESSVKNKTSKQKKSKSKKERNKKKLFIIKCECSEASLKSYSSKKSSNSSVKNKMTEKSSSKSEKKGKDKECGPDCNTAKRKSKLNSKKTNKSKNKDENEKIKESKKSKRKDSDSSIESISDRGDRNTHSDTSSKISEPGKKSSVCKTCTKDKKSLKDSKSSKTSDRSASSNTFMCQMNNETRKCPCHFPPVFGEFFQCTGAITGNCTCSEESDC